MNPTIALKHKIENILDEELKGISGVVYNDGTLSKSCTIIKSHGIHAGTIKTLESKGFHVGYICSAASQPYAIEIHLTISDSVAQEVSKK